MTLLGNSSTTPATWRLNRHALLGQEFASVDAQHRSAAERVCEALEQLERWRQLSPAGRDVVFAAAALTELTRPSVMDTEPLGRVTSGGYDRARATVARLKLWRRGIPFAQREEICALIAQCRVPKENPDAVMPVRRAIAASLETSCERLAVLAEAQAHILPLRHRDQALVHIDAFRARADSLGCRRQPFPFASDHSRYMYFRRPQRDPYHEAYDSTQGQVTLLVGLPGVGKDSWLRKHAPHDTVVTGSDLGEGLRSKGLLGREEAGSFARDTARQLLRRGGDFVWNAHHVSWSSRRGALGLIAGFNVRLRIVYLELEEAELRRRNKERAQPVAWGLIRRMLRRWDVPRLSEAHELVTVVPRTSLEA